MSTTESKQRYTVENGGIVARGPILHFANRPLYGNNTNSVVLGGDRPLIHYARGQYIYGTFMAALVRGNASGKWLHEADDITSIYQLGNLTWVVRDSSFPGTTVTLRTVPISGSSGMAIQVQVEGARAEDRLIWAYGGARQTSDASWDLDVEEHPELLERSFVPEDSTGNIARSIDDGFSLQLASATSFGKCSVPASIHIGDASAATAPAALLESSARSLPIAVGSISAEHLADVYWAIQGFTGTAQAPAPENLSALVPAEAFAQGLQHQEAIARQITVSTPDPYLNVMTSAMTVGIDGTWYPPVFVHGAMSWNIPFLGWRTLFGGTAFGWHDRVKAQAHYYISHQIRESDRLTARADPAMLLTTQHPKSRYYGVGRIDKDQAFYNMQSQFFDQLVHNWRWTADPELETILRPSLELHLQWLRECFERDGIYESYINTWPTDSVWYNGGGSVEATMYAYRGHAAARDMARRANDADSVAFHTSMLEKIRKAFFEKLWIPRKGHPGAYREQGGHQRLHEDPCLYSIFLPIDAGDLLSTEQAAQTLRYSETMLQNDRMPLGGRTVFTSNWVPGIWSVRENAPGDNYHLALAYFQTGMAEDGWDVFRGMFMQRGFGSPVPGGADFGDFIHMFGRTLVEGLLGYSPDYSNDKVTVSPHFPAAWDHASIETPDVAMRFERVSESSTFHITLHRAAPMTVHLPVYAEQVVSVTVDGQPAQFEVLPGFGQSIVQIQLSSRSSATIVVTILNALPHFPAIALDGNVGEAVSLRADRAKILSFSDPQSTLSNAVVREGILEGTIAANAGHHTVIARVDAGGAPQLRLFHIHVTDPAAEAAHRAQLIAQISADARWEPVNIGAAFNGDIRTIFQQQYLSPRPETVSLRIGTDGYSPWTFLYWESPPPVIDLDNAPNLLDASRHLVTPQRVPFVWSAQDTPARNVAFTSLWDNWPDRVAVPVNKQGEAMFLLIAGSTNVMQCNIANGVITFHYADGEEERLELIPPSNYWNLSPIDAHLPYQHQGSRSDYTDPFDAFAVPQPHPQTVQLGGNCRAMLLNHRLRADAELRSVTLETLSQDVVIGLMGLTMMNPRPNEP